MTCRAEKGAPQIKNVIFFKDVAAKKIIISYKIRAPLTDTLLVSEEIYNQNGRLLQGLKTKTCPLKGHQIIRRQFTWTYSKIQSQSITVALKVTPTRRRSILSAMRTTDSRKIKSDLLAIYGIRREAGHGKLRQARAFIKKLFSAAKADPRVQPFSHNGRQGINLIARIPGQSKSDSCLIICAHYDTAPTSPGADDNGSGVAGLLAVFRSLVSHRFEHTIEFVALDMEEEGAIGSRYYSSMLQSNGKHILGVFNLDMIGWCSTQINSQVVPENVREVFPVESKKIISNGNRGDFLLNIANPASLELSRKFHSSSQRYVPGLKIITLNATPYAVNKIPGLASSDHARFWQHGYQALHIGEGGATRNPLIDTVNDTVDLINFGFLSKVVQSLIASAGEICKINDPTEFKRQVNL